MWILYLEQEIDEAAFNILNEEDFKEMDIKIGIRKKLITIKKILNKQDDKDKNSEGSLNLNENEDDLDLVKLFDATEDKPRIDEVRL